MTTDLDGDGSARPLRTRETTPIDASSKIWFQNLGEERGRGEACEDKEPNRPRYRSFVEGRRRRDRRIHRGRSPVRVC